VIGLLAALAILFAVRAEPVETRPQSAPPATRPSTSSARTVEERADETATQYKLAGEVLIAKGDRILLDRGYGTIDPAGGAAHKAGERWRLASITKQVFAVMAVAADGDQLDTPLGVAAKQPALGATTLRQLLTHHSGLADPDATPADAAGVPGFYRAAAPDLGYCLSRPATPGAAFHYNNCDYLVAASIVIDDVRTDTVWPRGMAMARAGEVGVPGFVAGKAEPALTLANWGAAGGLIGSAPAVFAFDRALMTGKLLPPAGLKALWTPEGNGSYQALGQWVFPGRFKGCAAPKRIVQRDGEIYGIQARNFILPDDDLVVIVFTNRSSDDFKFGEVWEGKGFTYDLLSAVACS
jgi:D-alanyl-D-alanine carboxypeptidase